MKSKNTTDKVPMHPRNKHRDGYDFELLMSQCPMLKKFVFVNEFNTKTIDFANPEAVKCLNQSLLITYYDLQYWDIPPFNLCPPIPGRADYIHHLADFLAQHCGGTIPTGDGVLGLDIGIGANCIYPILGHHLYQWSFVGTDINEEALQNCKRIISKNPNLVDYISLQLQTNIKYIFKNIILPEDKFTFSICNPPFHSSEDEVLQHNNRKTTHLNTAKGQNFSGNQNELWCEGGELTFINQMIYESAKYPMQCLWFTTLVSKKVHLKTIYNTLNRVNVAQHHTISMAQGQKNSRFIAWTFQTPQQIKDWKFE